MIFNEQLIFKTEEKLTKSSEYLNSLMNRQYTTKNLNSASENYFSAIILCSFLKKKNLGIHYHLSSFGKINIIYKLNLSKIIIITKLIFFFYIFFDWINYNKSFHKRPRGFLYYGNIFFSIEKVKYLKKKKLLHTHKKFLHDKIFIDFLLKNSLPINTHTRDYYFCRFDYLPSKRNINKKVNLVRAYNIFLCTHKKIKEFILGNLYSHFDLKNA